MVPKFKGPNILAEVQKRISGMLGKNNNNTVLILSDGLRQDLKRYKYSSDFCTTG